MTRPINDNKNSNDSIISSTEYQETIQEALNALNKKNLVLILHSGSFPSSLDRDTGFGSLYSQDGYRMLEFAKKLGFNGLQLGPAGKTKSIDPSPYTGTLFSGNPLFIDLFALTQDEYGNILNVKQVEEIVSRNPNRGKNRIAYDYIYGLQDRLIQVAFNNFQKALGDNPTQSQVALEKEFENYKLEHKTWLIKDALYEALSLVHSNDYWPLWKNKGDQQLLSYELDEERIHFLKREYLDVISRYQFTQFILDKQKKKTIEFAEKLSVKLIADHQVAVSDRDYWANQEIFLENYLLGAPPDYFSKSGQAWGFPVLHPHKIVSTPFFKSLFKKVFRENPGGVRIDHIIGLIDPWVYPKGKHPKVEEGASRLYSSPEHPELCHFTHVWHEDINWSVESDHESRVSNISEEQLIKYSQTIKLILEVAHEEGICLENIICEDLGTLTTPVKEVLSKQDLSGIRITQFVDPDVDGHLYRGKNVSEQHWIMAGSHDNQPLILWVDDVFKKTDLCQTHARNLVDDLASDRINSEKEQLVEQLCHDKSLFLNYKFAELLASPSQNIQIFFTDLFGIAEFYNRPGLSKRGNWTLRLPSAYQDLYRGNLQSGTALNLPRVLSIALQSRVDEKDSSNLNSLILRLNHLAEELAHSKKF